MSMSTKFRGVFPPVVLPLTEDRQLDEVSFARVIERLIAAGVDGLFFLGSSGEVAFSTDARRDQVLRLAVEIVAGRLPVLAGVIDTETERVLEHVRRAEKFGVDALVATAPFYALGGEAEIDQHFRLIRKATELPLFAYDIPVCVHTKLSNDLLMRLAADGVLQGVKDSSGDDVSFRFLCLANKAAGSPLSLLTGHEVVVDGALLGGADGSVPGLANVWPDPYVEQWRAAQRSDWEEVRRLQDRLAQLMRIVMVTQGVQGFAAGIGAFKTAMQLLGVIETNQMPNPVQRLTGANVAAIEQVLYDCGLLP